jgi:hypothetical protein
MAREQIQKQKQTKKPTPRSIDLRTPSGKKLPY